MLEEKEYIKVSRCENLMGIIIEYQQKAYEGLCINIYDIRLRDENVHDGCGMHAWPFGLDKLKEYLGRPDVVSAINAEEKPVSWIECDMSVNRALETENQAPSYTLFPKLLESIPVHLFTYTPFG